MSIFYEIEFAKYILPYRKPWIDVVSEKLLQRHIAIVTLQEFLAKYNESLDIISAAVFLDHRLDEFAKYLTKGKPIQVIGDIKTSIYTRRDGGVDIDNSLIPVEHVDIIKRQHP